MLVFGCLAVVALNLIFLVEYLGDPLGQNPVLDARENLAWADRIAAGDLPAEPFYRALLYPWILARIPGPAAAALFGVICHLVSALLAGWIATSVWRTRSAGWIAAGAYSLYPVAQYFSVQVLDITFATTLFLGAVACAVAGSARDTRCARHLCLAAAGALAGLAVLARPNFLPAALLLPTFPLFALGAEVRVRVAAGAVAGLCLAVVLAGQGLVNRSLSGEFRILPWQGSYNLYAANKPGANGRYFSQSVNFDRIPEGMNPTRMESEFLYREATGSASAEPSLMNRYWKSRLGEMIADNPAGWVGLMARKVLYLFNDWEQYNNLTYAFHKPRFAVLAVNPLGWGVLLAAALAGGVAGWRRADRSALAAVFLLAAAYGAGVVLFFVSARFRLPLAPLACVFAGGLAWLHAGRLREIGARGGLLAAAGLMTIAVIAYGNWAGARDRATYLQDELLMAAASASSARDDLAIRYAEAVLLRDPRRPEALRISVVARYNQIFEGGPGLGGDNDWRAIEERLGRLEAWDAATLFIRGVVEWRRGESGAAVATWQRALSDHGGGALSSAKGLQLAGELNAFNADDYEMARIAELMDPASVR